MTKRFTIENERTLVDNRRGKKYVFSWVSDAKEVCYLLNQLNDESELLKRTKECYKSRWKNQLKANGKLIEENEQLKQRIKGVYELLTLEVDVFSDKATEHDINAYRELRELDNKDAFCIATATKKAIKMLKGD